MKNILNIDTRINPHFLGYANEGSSGNVIAMNFTTSDILTAPYIEITRIDGGIETLDYNGITEISFNRFQNQGVVKARLMATDFESEYIVINILENIETTDNAIVKLKNNEFEVRKVKSKSGGEVVEMNYISIAEINSLFE